MKYLPIFDRLPVGQNSIQVHCTHSLKLLYKVQKLHSQIDKLNIWNSECNRSMRFIMKMAVDLENNGDKRRNSRSEVQLMMITLLERKRVTDNLEFTYTNLKRRTFHANIDVTWDRIEQATCSVCSGYGTFSGLKIIRETTSPRSVEGIRMRWTVPKIPSQAPVLYKTLSKKKHCE